MIEQAFERDSLLSYVGALRANLDAPQLREAAARAAEQIPGQGAASEKLRAAMPSVDAVAPSSGGGDTDKVPYLARDPIVSLLQSSLESKLRERGVPDTSPARRGLLSG